MASEDEEMVENTVASEGNRDAMGEKLIQMLSRLNENLSPELKSRLQDMMTQYETLGDGEKEDFKKDLKDKLTTQFTTAARIRYFMEMWHSTIVVGCVALIIFLFVFFGYKLYKSLKEKERKRDEKKKLRQQKKKK